MNTLTSIIIGLTLVTTCIAQPNRISSQSASLQRLEARQNTKTIADAIKSSQYQPQQTIICPCCGTIIKIQPQGR